MWPTARSVMQLWQLHDATLSGAFRRVPHLLPPSWWLPTATVLRPDAIGLVRHYGFEPSLFGLSGLDAAQTVTPVH